MFTCLMSGGARDKLNGIPIGALYLHNISIHFHSTTDPTPQRGPCVPPKNLPARPWNSRVYRYLIHQMLRESKVNCRIADIMWFLCNWVFRGRKYFIFLPKDNVHCVYRALELTVSVAFDCQAVQSNANFSHKVWDDRILGSAAHFLNIQNLTKRTLQTFLKDNYVKNIVFSDETLCQ